MGISKADLGKSLEALAAIEPAFAPALARLPISGIESLNVSNAAAVALYAASVA